MVAPRLNRTLTLQERQMTPDGQGGFDVAWVTLGHLPAAVDARSGRERFGGERVSSSISTRITVRAAPIGATSRPSPQQRFLEDTRIYAIRAVGEADVDGLYLECWAEEGVLT